MPPFTESGYLPPGIWVMSWADFWARYGYNSRRANLLSGLMFALKLLVRANCQTITSAVVSSPIRSDLTTSMAVLMG
jgi:hypothetical protein